MYRPTKNTTPYIIDLSKKIICLSFIHLVLACAGILTISSVPEALLFNTKNDIFYHPRLSLSQGLAGTRALGFATVFGLAADINLTGQLALTYEYTPATTPTGGPTLPKPSVLWLFSIGLLPLLIVRQPGKKRSSK